MTQDISSAVKHIIRDQIGVSEERVMPEALLIEDLGALPLGLVELTRAFEKAFSIDMPPVRAVEHLMRVTRSVALCALALGCRRPPASMTSSGVEVPTGSDAASSTVSSDGPDCHGFGGKIHGATTCVRVDLLAGTSQPLAVRPMPGPNVVSAKCGESLRLAHARLKIVCDRLEASDAGPWTKPVVVSVDIAHDDGPDTASPKRLRLDRSDAFWDFINVWARERDGGVDLAIDYGVLD